jgi:hypothetical protein
VTTSAEGSLAPRTRSGTPVRDEIAPIAFLIGRWTGEGDGAYPTTEPFRYREEIEVEDVGDAFLLYGQRSWAIGSHALLHAERGVLRAVGEGRVDLTLAHPIGVAEVSEGTVSGTALELRSTAVPRSSTGSPVAALARRYRVDGDELSYEVDLALDHVPGTLHVWATLARA